MKILIAILFLLNLPLWAQDKEGDLQLPVSDVSEIQKEEEKLPPTIDEVEMKEKDDKRKKPTPTEGKIHQRTVTDPIR